MYRSLITALFITILFCQCKETKTGIVDTWILKSQQIDFGADANIPVPMVSKRTITFNADGIVKSNGNMCAITGDIDRPSKGNYDTTAKTMSFSPCGPGLGATKYELAGDELKVFFVCNGVCFQQYTRVN